METFTYDDYIKCIHTLRLNSIFQLAEEEEKYNLETIKQKKEKNSIYIKLIKRILRNRREVANFINEYVGLTNKIFGKDLEKYDNNFVLERFKSRENDIMYKLKDKDVYFVIRYQDKIDNNVIYEMLNTCIDIIYALNGSKRIKEETKYAEEIPIIIYTGREKWDVAYDFSEMQISDYIFENYKIDFRYNLIETNQISTKSLIKGKSLLSYILALQKTRGYKNFRKVLSKILLTRKEKKSLQKELYEILCILIKNLDEYNFNNNEIKKIRQQLINYFLEINYNENNILKKLDITKSELEELNGKIRKSA